MIYILDDYESITDEVLERMMGLLPPKRREKAEKFRYRNGKLTCAVAYLLFLYGYRREFGGRDIPDFALDENEKPFLPDRPGVHFNLSHCNRATVCMLGHAPVGIDIQELRPVKEEFSARICSERELERIAASPNPQREFTRIWTEKEAISKYTGEGIFRDVRCVSADAAPDQSMVATTQPLPDVFVTACARIEDADFTFCHVTAEDLLKLSGQ